MWAQCGLALVNPIDNVMRNENGQTVKASAFFTCFNLFPMAYAMFVRLDYIKLGHDFVHPFAAATTFLAASVNPSAVVKLRPLSCSIFLPCATLVPSSRTTNGTLG